MEKLGAEKDAIDTQLADPEVYSEENKEKLKKLLTDQAYIQKELDQAEADWLAASEEHESLSANLKENP